MKSFIICLSFILYINSSVVFAGSDIVEMLGSEKNDHQRTGLQIPSPTRNVADLEIPVIPLIKFRPITGVMYYKHEGPVTPKISDTIPFFGLGGTLEWHN